MEKNILMLWIQPFRDGFQSVFGGRVLMDDFFPAVEAAKKAGITILSLEVGLDFRVYTST